MKKTFGSLRVGEKFYPAFKDNSMSLKYQCIKVSELELPSDIGSSCLVTLSAFRHVRFNSIVLECPNDKMTNTEGYFSFFHDSDPVYIDSKA